jgi:hypothetical protein
MTCGFWRRLTLLQLYHNLPGGASRGLRLALGRRMQLLARQGRLSGLGIGLPVCPVRPGLL